MTYDASNRKSVRRAEKAAKLAEANRLNFIRSSMATLGGREYIYSLLNSCSIFRTPFVRGDSLATAFNCGQQNIGLTIFADIIAHCPNEYLLMIAEQSTKEAANDRRDTNDRSTDPDATIPGDDATGTDPDTGRYDQGPDDGPNPADIGAYLDERGLLHYNSR